MAGRKNVRRVEANAEPFGRAHIPDDVGQMLEGVTQACALTRRCLQRDPRFHLWQARQDLVDRRDDLFQTGSFARAEMRAGMQDDERQTQLVGPRELLGQSAQRVGVKLRVGRRQIDEVIGVRENRRQLPALRMFEEGLDFLARQRPREPLHVVFHENLHRRAFDRTRPLDRPMHAAADRHVRA